MLGVPTFIEINTKLIILNFVTLCKIPCPEKKIRRSDVLA